MMTARPVSARLIPARIVERAENGRNLKEGEGVLVQGRN
jgi:hypothetical protein